MNNIKGYYRENNTCSVEGKCLPMSGSEVPKIDTTDNKKMWYEELLDEVPSQLDFMMTNNNVINNTPLAVQPKVAVQEPTQCTTCTKN
jgi:hypothetical protein